jgi:hypothetical protein
MITTSQRAESLRPWKFNFGDFYDREEFFARQTFLPSRSPLLSSRDELFIYALPAVRNSYSEQNKKLSFISTRPPPSPTLCTQRKAAENTGELFTERTFSFSLPLCAHRPVRNERKEKSREARLIKKMLRHFSAEEGEIFFQFQFHFIPGILDLITFQLQWRAQRSRQSQLENVFY